MLDEELEEVVLTELRGELELLELDVTLEEVDVEEPRVEELVDVEEPRVEELDVDNDDEELDVDDVGLEVAVVEVDEEVDEVKLEELDVVDDSVEDFELDELLEELDELLEELDELLEELDVLLEELDVLELTTTTLIPPVTPGLFENAILGLFSLI
jgi:hypothetical protein